jgi:hypothetical protein
VDSFSIRTRLLVFAQLLLPMLTQGEFALPAMLPTTGMPPPLHAYPALETITGIPQLLNANVALKVSPMIPRT